MNALNPMPINEVMTVDPGQPDDVFILAASWEKRSLGVASHLQNYNCAMILITVYDTVSELRSKNLDTLKTLLRGKGEIRHIKATHSNPLPNVREIIELIRTVAPNRSPRITFDITTFTRKHLLQLLQGLDLAGMLSSCHFYHTEPADYHTEDNNPISQGVAAVRTIETFAGRNNPSLESLLVLFLGYEGNRALALWEHLEPNITLAVIPDPPFRNDWHGRTEAQNRYLLSCLSKEHVLRTHSRFPADTEALLNYLVSSEQYNCEKFNYRIAPLGTKPQILGLYRFLRRQRGLATVMYASPVRYREENAPYSVGRTWLLDRSCYWADVPRPIARS